MNNLCENNEIIFEILDVKNNHILTAENILNEFDKLQDSNPLQLKKNIQNFQLIQNSDFFKSHLHEYCTLSFNKCLNNPILDLNLNKDNFLDLKNNTNIEYSCLSNPLDNVKIKDINQYEKKTEKKNIKFISVKKKLSNPFQNNKNVTYSNISQPFNINKNSQINNNIGYINTDSSFLSIIEDNSQNSKNNKFNGNIILNFFILKTRNQKLPLNQN